MLHYFCMGEFALLVEINMQVVVIHSEAAAHAKQVLVFLLSKASARPSK